MLLYSKLNEMAPIKITIIMQYIDFKPSFISNIGICEESTVADDLNEICCQSH